MKYRFYQKREGEGIKTCFVSVKRKMRFLGNILSLVLVKFKFTFTHVYIHELLNQASKLDLT